MDRLDYTRSVATMRVYEKRLLDSVRIDRLVDSKDASEAFKIISETEYGKSMGGAKDPKDFELVLKNELIRVYKDMYRMINDKELIDILALKYDYQNIKTLLKNFVLGKETDTSTLSDMGTISTSLLKTYFETQDLKNLDKHFIDAIVTTKEDYEKNKDPQMIDVTLDIAYYNHLLELGKKYEDVKVVNDYIKLNIDKYNVLAVLRAKKQEKELNFVSKILAPGGFINREEILNSYTETIENMANRYSKYEIGQRIKKGILEYNEKGNLGDLEKEFDNLIMDRAKTSKKVIFGPEPLFSYIVAKERENKLLRIIMVSKLNNISNEKIRERLRDLYV